MSSGSSEVDAGGPLASAASEGLAGCHLSPPEEVLMSSSCFTQDLLIAENAG
jgi:hypothetical protein